MPDAWKYKVYKMLSPLLFLPTFSRIFHDFTELLV